MSTYRLTNFKTGIFPNVKNIMNVNNLTPTQKMNLVYSRIWGTHIGDNYKSGIHIYNRSKIS
jgi:hypothetical protein